MHSFEAVWWISCSRFKHCVMVPNSSCRHLSRLAQRSIEISQEFFKNFRANESKLSTANSLPVCWASQVFGPSKNV